MDDPCQYVLLDPYNKALPAIRSALNAAGLDIAAEWDVTYDLRQDYGVVLAPCRVLIVYNSINLLQNTVMNATYAINGQVSIAVCEAEGHTRVSIRGHQPELVDQALSALRQIGIRQLAPAAAA